MLNKFATRERFQQARTSNVHSQLPVEPFVEALEAAAFLHISPPHLKKLAREGRIPAYPRGDGQRRRWLFLISELAEWMRSRVNSACDPCRETRSEG